MHDEKQPRTSSRGDKSHLETSASGFTGQLNFKKKIHLHTKRPDLAKIACQSLGIEYDDLTQKTREELHDPKKLKEANDLIYSHYLKRYNRRVAQVDAKIKELLHQGKGDLGQISELPGARCHSSSELHDIGHRYDHKAHPRHETVQDYVVTTQSTRQNKGHRSLPREVEHDSSGDWNVDPNDEIATHVVTNYKRKLERVQEQWEEQTRNFRNKPIGDPNRLLNHALQSQIDKLKRNVEKADKYAQSIVELNNKRNELKEEILERDRKVKKIKRKLVKERNESIQKNKEYFEERMKEIRKQRREYNAKLRKKATKMGERFEDLEKKLVKTEEERKENLKSKELEFMVKVSKAKELKDAEYDGIYQDYKHGEVRSHRQVEAMLSERRRKCEDSAKSFRESYEKAKEKRDALLTERDSRTIKKIFQKFQGTEHVKEMLQANMKKKYEELLEKQEIHRKNYLEVLRNKNKWTKSVVESYRKSQERVKEFQEEKIKTLILKKETNDLRRMDQVENYSGLMKLRELRNCQIMDKERADSLKMNMFREQSLILSQARIDVDRKVKIKVDEVITSAFKVESKSPTTQKKSQRSASAAQL